MLNNKLASNICTDNLKLLIFMEISVPGRKIETRKHPIHGTVCYSVSNKHNPFKKMKLLCLGLGCTTYCQNIWETTKVIKLKNSNLSSIKFFRAQFWWAQNANYVTAARSNSILDQQSHLRTQGIYESGVVPSSATE